MGNRRRKMTSRPRETVVPHTLKTRWTKRVQRKAFPIGYSPSQIIWRTWRRMPYIPLKEESRTTFTRVPRRRRDEGSIPRAATFGDLITADHTVLNEGSESRSNHRYVVVVQDLVSQWIQSYPCKYKNSQETEKSPRKFLEPSKKQKLFSDNSL